MPNFHRPSQRGRAQLCRSASRLALAAAAIGGIAFTAPMASAATLIWTGASSSDWADASNWNPSATPTGADAVVIDPAASNAHVLSGTATAADVTVGDTGNNVTMFIDSGAALNSGDILLGNNAGAGGTINIGGNATLTSNGLLTVGNSGAGSLIVGGGVTSNLTVLADQTGSTGLGIIGGPGAVWISIGQMIVGNGGQGTLQITNGGSVQAQADLLMGNSAGGVGLILVDGVGSTLSVAQHLQIGETNVGELDLHNGGTATVSGVTTLGEHAGAAGHLTVDGAGSVFTDTGDVYVGDVGTGTMTLSHGGVANVNYLGLGYDTGSSGTLIVEDMGSSLVTPGYMDVGLNGTGHLSILAGGSVQASVVTIAGATGSNGDATVSGVGAQLLASANVLVGVSGTGSLTVSGGGTVSDNLGVVGENNGTGTAIVDGAGSVWNNNSLIDVGTGGTGQVTVRNGGSLNSGSGTIGEIGGTGTVTVDGAGSQWAIQNDIQIGNSGTGSLSVSHGGAVANINAYLGVNTNDNGSAIVDGTDSFWTGTGVLFVGSAGNGTLLVSNGGTARFDSFVLADTNTATASVTVDGGSLGATSSAADIIGNHGSATVLIKNGGVLSDTAASIGQEASGNGTVTVDGAGSVWNNSGALAVGYAGAGVLHVVNGGTVMASAVDVSLQPGASGMMSVDGVGSSVDAGAGVVVGGAASGLMAITNGGQVNGLEGIVGYLDTGAVTVDGAGSQWGGMSQGLFLGYQVGGNGTLTLSNGGQVEANVITLANDAGTVGVLNIGAAAGSAAVAPGMVQASSLVFGPGTGSLVFNHTATDYVFAPTISGTGAIQQIAGATFLTGDGSNFSGPVTISGGALHVNASYKNAAVSVTGGALMGNGAVGSVTAKAGGHVAPGNSIGTLTVNGDFNAASGSVYDAELNSAGQSDKLLVGGAANIASGAQLKVTKLDASDYVGGTQYTLLTAAGGVNGIFQLTGDVVQSGLLSETLAYDANNVYLRVTQTATLSSFALTPNQKAVAAAGDVLPPASPLRAALFALPDGPTVRGALDAASGEIFASARTALFQDSRFLREAALQRAQAQGGGALSLWGQGFGDWGSVDGDGNAAALDYSDTGFVGGVDVPVGTVRLGLVSGYSHTSLNVAARNSKGGSDNYHLGAYAGMNQGPVVFGLGAAYSWNDLSVARTVSFPGFGEALSSYGTGGTTQIFGEAGYKLDMDGVALEPFGNLAFVDLRQRADREGGGASALNVAGGGASVTFTTLGMRGAQDFMLGEGRLTARAALGWRHAFGGVAPVVLESLAGGNNFAIAGVAIARDGAAIDAGLDAVVGDGVTMGLGYSGQFASGARDNGVKGDLRWAF
jgi:outer membrane autotransporter protein